MTFVNGIYTSSSAPKTNTTRTTALIPPIMCLCDRRSDPGVYKVGLYQKAGETETRKCKKSVVVWSELEDLWAAP